MEVTFTGGTDRERALVQTALNSLLHLDLTRWGLSVEFEWVDDPAAEGHNDLGATITNGDGFGTIQLRNDLDTFRGLGPPFYIETVAHELGHLLTRHLPFDGKQQVAAMFGGSVEDIDNYPTGPAWEDRPFEGIAETFKDAFLPRNLREFPNRTRRRIPIYRYPDFRRIYRDAALEGGVGSVPAVIDAIEDMISGRSFVLDEFGGGTIDVWREGPFGSIEDNIAEDVGWDSAAGEPFMKSGRVVVTGTRRVGWRLPKPNPSLFKEFWVRTFFGHALDGWQADLGFELQGGDIVPTVLGTHGSGTSRFPKDYGVEIDGDDMYAWWEWESPGPTFTVIIDVQTATFIHARPADGYSIQPQDPLPEPSSQAGGALRGVIRSRRAIVGHST